MAPSVPRTAAPYVVERAMNDHGAMTLVDAESNETVHVVEYADSDVRETLKLATDGSRVNVRLERAGPRSNAWRALDVEGGIALGAATPRPSP